jgi:hypothetical protein
MSKDAYIQQLESHIEELQEKSTLCEEYAFLLGALLPEWYVGPDTFSPSPDFERPSVQHIFKSSVCTFAILAEEKRTGKCRIKSFYLNSINPMKDIVESHDIRSMKKYIEEEFEAAMIHWCPKLTRKLIHTHIKNINQST